MTTIKIWSVKLLLMEPPPTATSGADSKRDTAIDGTAITTTGDATVTYPLTIQPGMVPTEG